MEGREGKGRERDVTQEWAYGAECLWSSALTLARATSRASQAQGGKIVV